MILLNFKNIFVTFVFFSLALQMYFSDITKAGVTRGLLISANVIIPSLFPFMVCVTFLARSGIAVKNKNSDTRYALKEEK